MRLAAMAIAATMVTTPTLAADSDYTAAALAKCIRGYTQTTTRVTAADDLRTALQSCAVLYRIHRVIAMNEGASGQAVDNDFRDGVALLAEEIMGR